MNERTYYIGRMYKDIVELTGCSTNKNTGKTHCSYIVEEGTHCNSTIGEFIQEYRELRDFPLFTATMNRPIQSGWISIEDKELFDASELAYLEIHKNIKPLMTALRRRTRRNEIMIDTKIEPTEKFFFNYTKTTPYGDYWSQQLIKELKIIVRNIYESV